MKAIAEHAFDASPYPVIISIENHCSIQQQVRTLFIEIIVSVSAEFIIVLLANSII